MYMEPAGIDAESWLQYVYSCTQHARWNTELESNIIGKQISLCLCDRYSLKNADDTNATCADSMISIEALSTAGQTVALL